MLPIEFARISRDGRLTLVIHPGSPELRTYWAISTFESLDEARQNLSEREGTALTRIDAVFVNDKDTGTMSDTRTVVRSWLKEQRALDAAVWTGLESNWEAVRNKPFSPDDAVRYLSELKLERDDMALRYDRTCEYIRNAPEQVQTPVRKILHEMKGFKAATLSAVLFEQSEVDG